MPSFFRAMVWLNRVDRERMPLMGVLSGGVTVRPESTSVGRVRPLAALAALSVLVTPNWPYSFRPQAYSLPSLSMAML